MKPARILFFIVGAMPTADDYEAAEAIGANVSFRNASAVPPDGALEECDGVAGAVPARYAEAFKPAAEAVEAFKAAAAAKRKASGDVPAPVSVGSAPAPAGDANAPADKVQAPAAGNAPTAPAGTAAAPKAWGQAAAKK